MMDDAAVVGRIDGRCFAAAFDGSPNGEASTADAANMNQMAMIERRSGVIIVVLC